MIVAWSGFSKGAPGALRFRQWGSDYGAWQRVADETAGLDCVGLVASAEA